MTLSLVSPNIELLSSYLTALEEGFYDMQLGFAATQPNDIRADPNGFLKRVTDTKPFSVVLKDKSYTVTDHEILWITDGERFIGSVALRYDGDDTIINHYAGHSGLAIRPSLINLGYGVRMWRDVMHDIVKRGRAKELSYMLATCNRNNTASARLIEFLGGIRLRDIDAKDSLDGTAMIIYRIDSPN